MCDASAVMNASTRSVSPASAAVSARNASATPSNSASAANRIAAPFAFVVGRSEGGVTVIREAPERAGEELQCVDPAFVEAVHEPQTVADALFVERRPVEAGGGHRVVPLREACGVQQVGEVRHRCVDERVAVGQQRRQQHLIGGGGGELGVGSVEELGVADLDRPFEAGLHGGDLARRCRRRGRASDDLQSLGLHAHRHPTVDGGVEPAGRADHDVDVGFVVAEPLPVGVDPPDRVAVRVHEVGAVGHQPPPERRPGRMHPYEPAVDVVGADRDRPPRAVDELGCVAHRTVDLGEGHVDLQEPLGDSPHRGSTAELRVVRHRVDQLVAWNGAPPEERNHRRADVVGCRHGAIVAARPTG